MIILFSFLLCLAIYLIRLIFKKNILRVDLVAKKTVRVSSVLAGTVILSDWSSEVGYVIGGQHKNNYLSFYKHNSILLKNVGDFVAAGEHIAVSLEILESFQPVSSSL